VLHDPYFKGLFHQLGAPAGLSSVTQWVCSFESSAGGAVYSPHELASNENPNFLLFLDELRRRCVLDIEAQLRVACIRQEIPREGVCLVFPDNLSICYFVEYHMRAEQVHIRFVDCLESPKALLGLEAAAALTNARSKNLAKSFIQSGHKTIIHGGVLTHVDRRVHPQVFGPSIDTLVIASILGAFVRSHCPASVMEIGVGSGHIYGTAAVYASDALELCGVDIEPSAILCTNTNVRRHSEVFGTTSITSSLVIGSFDPEFYKKRFDLIVSNPPYISVSEGEALEGRHKDATSGTALLEQIMHALPNLLTEGGRALLMLSSTTADADRLLPQEFEFEECVPSGPITVPFDVDFALDNPSVIDHLKETGAIWQDGATYKHGLRPVWVRRL
jgi:methylase of polypeptide subunit release factors